MILKWKAVLLSCVLALTGLTASGQQPDPEILLLEAAAAEIGKQQPLWNFGRPICNLTPLMDEPNVFCGSWHLNTPDAARLPTIVATATLHRASNAAAVTRFLTQRSSFSQAGWSTTPYDIGVPAFLTTHPGGSLEILFGRGRFLVTVNGKSKEEIEQVARAMLRQIDGIPR